MLIKKGNKNIFIYIYIYLLESQKEGGNVQIDNKCDSNVTKKRRYGLLRYVVIAHWMLCCPVGYVERGDLTCCDTLNRSDNYLLLGPSSTKVE